ncbi:hypothetical protein J4E83_001346 [Alternaria metachromatica]|uniref:uncharacterized protein n=1 Tax=Alternaria metachromatica TaxID=283354 RepID=UPI0020C25C40|nr:uncharacterized protein J4E83_001346 [Alternaria metachromatica]KAI4636391.1 hypothetical protein J4E83_001346 [Alternaria metachromatica]
MPPKTKTAKKKAPAPLLTLKELESYGKEKSPDGFAKIPAPSAFIFQDQVVNSNGSDYKMFVGHINSEGKKKPLYAHITRPCRVEFRYDVNIVAAREDRDQFELIKELSHFYSGSKKIVLPGLETIIAYLFVADDKWFGIMDGARGDVSLKAFKLVCDTLAKVLDKDVCEKREPGSLEKLKSALIRNEAKLMGELVEKTKEIIQHGQTFGDRLRDMFDQTSGFEPLEEAQKYDMEEFEKLVAGFEKRFGKI